MSLRKREYTSRLLDGRIEEYLKIFGALSVEGPKWCGKTWASLNQANSVVYLDDEGERKKAELDLDLILEREKPELIDEWNLVPQVWDAVRHKCDLTEEKGNYILTCSTRLPDEEQKAKIHHSGAGRIGAVRMRTMSLLEMGRSTGLASIRGMRKGRLKNRTNRMVDLQEIAECIVRGGWPSNQKTSVRNIGVIPRSYMKAVLERDINDDKRRSAEKMRRLLVSLARNESTVASVKTLLDDMDDGIKNGQEIESRKTLDDYLDVLERLYLIDNQPAYAENYRSRERVGKAVKRHLADPSLACAMLGLTVDKLLGDLRTFGLLFEALVEKDLRVYMDVLGGELRHFRDNVTGLEVDAILEFEDGGYAAAEIKLGMDKIDEAKKNLLRLAQNMETKPDFMCVIVGKGDIIARDPETGIYIVPAFALAP